MPGDPFLKMDVSERQVGQYVFLPMNDLLIIPRRNRETNREQLSHRHFRPVRYLNRLPLIGMYQVRRIEEVPGDILGGSRKVRVSPHELVPP